MTKQSKRMLGQLFTVIVNLSLLLWGFHLIEGLKATDTQEWGIAILMAASFLMGWAYRVAFVENTAPQRPQ